LKETTMTTRSGHQVGQLNEYLAAAPELLQDSNSLVASHSGNTAMPIDAYQVLVTKRRGPTPRVLRARSFDDIDDDLMPMLVGQPLGQPSDSKS
jgi:hypothetical protein